MKNSKKILFVCHTTLDRLNSAIKVRSYNLIKNLREFGEVFVIQGNRRFRRLRIINFIFSGRIYKVDYMYMEPSTTSAIEMDILILLICKLMRIPVGIFIRDAHPFFQEFRRGLNFKTWLLFLGWHLSVRFYTCFSDVLFVHTASFAALFKHKNKVLLPPGGLHIQLNKIETESKPDSIFYIGGAGEKYDLETLVEGYKLLKIKHPYLKCILGLREAEKRFWHIYQGIEGVSIVHIQSTELPGIMDRVILNVIALKKSPYLSFIVPLKLYELMSYGKPMVVSNNFETARLVKRFKTGLVYTSRNDFMEKVAHLLENPEEAEKLGRNGYNFINNGNLWRDRAELITKELSSVKKSTQ
ncbi:glycosyltransferase [bacterium]|nr:glycosyltransferase [bacterium]